MSKTRIPLPSAQEVYRVAGEWRERCLLGDGALFGDADGRTPATGAELVDALDSGVDPDESRFLGRLRSQLSGSGPAVHGLAAELLYVHLLIARSATVGEQQKRKLVESVLGRPVPDEFAAALKAGLINPGQGFNTYRWRHLGYLARYYTAVKRDGDPRAAFDAVDDQGAWLQRHALEHLLFPDERSPVVSRDHRAAIARAWDAPDGLVPLAESLEPNVRWGQRGFVNFYRAPYVWRWQEIDDRWKSFAAWGKRLIADVDLEAEERDYKLRTAAQLAEVRASLGTGEWKTALIQALTGTNLIGWRALDPFRAWLTSADDAADVLAELWRDPGPESVDRFRARLPVEVAATTGAFLSIASCLLGAVDVTAFPPWRATAVDEAYRRTKYAKPEPTATDGERYAVYLVFLDQVRDLMAREGGPQADRLDAQGVVWALMNYDPPQTWSDEQRSAFLSWRANGKPTGPVEAKPVPEETTLADLAAKVHLPEEFLDEIEDLLEDRKQVVFQGPPGTGKTFVAKQLARHVAKSDDRVRVVQFHASYSYEDFVEGYRPRPEGGFVRVDGPLLAFAEAARANPAEKHILVIDELNRANVPRVFGELYYLLEYRDEPARLLYGETEFCLPENLYIIATMNTADRSVALLDSALRRRFFFIDFHADADPVSGVLERYLTATHPGMTWVAKVVAEANKALADPDVAIGPSHFMRSDLDDRWVRRAWEHAVLPVLRDHFHGTPAKLAEFELAALRKKVDPAGADAEGVDPE